MPSAPSSDRPAGPTGAQGHAPVGPLGPVAPPAPFVPGPRWPGARPSIVVSRADDDPGGRGSSAGYGVPPPIPMPVLESDLLPLRLTHRLARRDTERLTRAADGLASGTTRFDEKRALAFGECVERVCDEIARHHDGEDELIFPLVEAHAGAAVDLADLAADHVALHSLLGEVRRGARSVVAALMLRPAAVATATDFSRMRDLTAHLAELAEMLEEHRADSERVVLAVLTTHVPRAEWRRMQRVGRVRRTEPWAPGPRLLSVATPDEAAAIRARPGRAAVVAMRLAGARLRRRERLVYGPELEG